MDNKELSKIFYEIADYLEAEKVAFKPAAWRKAALNIEALKENVDEIYEKDGVEELKKIPGVGESIAKNIEEYLKTGSMKYREKLKKRLPVDLEEIIRVEGLGPKRAKILYQKLDIKNLKDLEKAANRHKIAPLFGFGEKIE